MLEKVFKIRSRGLSNFRNHRVLPQQFYQVPNHMSAFELFRYSQ